MILLKANEELKKIFNKIVKTMGENVNWTEIFIISNNDLILLGKGRSWFFNFDNRRAQSNFIDVEINEDAVEVITENELLENALNMTLYTFGKWGQIKGLKVEKDYDQLNKLLNYILEEIHMEAVLTTDNLRFFKDDIQITYEEIIQMILEKAKAKVENSEEKEDAAETDEEKIPEDSLGLWHKIVWKSKKFSFVKEEISEEERNQSRLGNDFYMVNYKCPECGEKLYMVVYPAGKEFRIETEDGGVYLARAYTCKSCNSLYTPKPDKLLAEGDVYALDFEEDKVAYEDYLELMGKWGERTSNSNFNQYEADYHREKQKDGESEGKDEELISLDDICSNMETMTGEEIEQLSKKMDEGFFPEISVEQYRASIVQELQIRKSNKNQELEIGKGNKEKKLFSTDERGNFAGAKDDTLSSLNESKNQEGNSRRKNRKEKKQEEKWNVETNQKSERKQYSDVKEVEVSTAEPLLDFEEARGIVKAISNGEKEEFIRRVEKLAPKHLRELKTFLQSEKELEENTRKNGIDIVDRHLYKENEKKVLEKAVACKDKNYSNIETAIEEIEGEELAESVKTSVLNSLRQLLAKRGKQDLEHLISQVPVNVNKKQYVQFRDKIDEYKSVDTHSYHAKLDELRDKVEITEIEAFIKKVNPRDRKSHMNLYQRLKEQQFEERNANPFLEKIHKKIQTMDEAAIRKICPEPAEVTFEEGIMAYEEITLGDFLPELKSDALGMLNQRLTKIKADECEQLVHKLSKELGNFIRPENRIYFNHVRKMLKGKLDDAEAILINNALKTFATKMGKYEFPVMVCDTSFSKNGERGFVLTANHIFYNNMFSNGIIDIMDVDNIHEGNGMLHKGIYVTIKGNETIKISNSLKSRELKSIARVLNEFTTYLKEKPKSRDISYLAKEVHQVKCCYRCGFVYKEGSICPKCGSKYNE